VALAAQWTSPSARRLCPVQLSCVGLGESSLLLLEYSVEHLIEYSSTRQRVRRTAQRRSPKCEKQFIDGRQIAKVKAVSRFLHEILQL